jgi:excisionase family DNA binding protein
MTATTNRVTRIGDAFKQSSAPRADWLRSRLFLRHPQIEGESGEGLAGDSRAESQLLTVSEACAALRISRWQLYRLMHERQLGSIHIGRRRLIPAKAIQALIERLAAEADT